MGDRSGGRRPLGDAAGEKLERLQSQRSQIDNSIKTANADHNDAVKKQAGETRARVAELQAATANEQKAHDDKIKSLQSTRDTKVAALQQKAAQLDEQMQAHIQSEERSIATAPSVAVGAARSRATTGLAGMASRPVAGQREGAIGGTLDHIRPHHRRQQPGASGTLAKFTDREGEASDSDDGASDEVSQLFTGAGEGTVRAFTGNVEPYIHENFTTVIHFDGKWHEIECYICGANRPQDVDNFFDGVPGLLRHITHSRDHRSSLDRKDILRRGIKRVFGPEDVSRLAAGHHPASGRILTTTGSGRNYATRTDRSLFGDQRKGSAASSQGRNEPGTVRGVHGQGNGMKRKRAASPKVKTCGLETSASRTSKSANYGPDVLVDDYDSDTAFHPTAAPIPQFNMETFLNGASDKRARTAPSGTGDFANGRSQGTFQESYGAGMDGAAVATAVHTQYHTGLNTIRGPEPDELYPTYGQGASSSTARPADLKQNEGLRKHQEKGYKHTTGASTARYQRDMIQSPSLPAVTLLTGNEKYLHHRIANSVQLSGVWHIVRCKFCYANAKEMGKNKLVHFRGIRELKQHVEDSHHRVRYDDLNSWCDYQKIDNKILKRVTDPKFSLRELKFGGNFRYTGQILSRAANETVKETRERTDTRPPNAARQGRDPWNLSAE